MTFYISSGQLFVLQMAHDDMAFYSFQIDIARALKELIKKEIVVKWQKIVHNIGSWISGIDIR